jgi:hypothetical protein
MLTTRTVLRALPDLKSVCASYVAVAAAGTAGALVMNSQLDFAERAGTFDHEGNSQLRLVAQRRPQSMRVSRSYRLAPREHAVLLRIEEVTALFVGGGGLEVEVTCVLR